MVTARTGGRLRHRRRAVFVDGAAGGGYAAKVLIGRLGTPSLWDR